MATFQPSPYQQAIFDFITTGRGSANMVAVAGAGKTTTALHSLEFLPAHVYATYLAFNKKIVVDTEAKLRETDVVTGQRLFNVTCKLKVATFHSVCFNAWRFYKKTVREPDPNKVRDLMDKRFGDDDVARYSSFATKMVSLAKNAGVGMLVPNDVATWTALSDHYDVYPDVEGATLEEGITIAQKLLQFSIDAADASPSHIDYDDMLYMPLIRNVRFFQVDWLFVDEAQDTNDVQLAIMRRILKPGGRMIAIGDPKQAIYGFRGASADAMDKVAKAFNCITLPLTISYRCSQAVVRAAQRLFRHIEAHPGAPEGSEIHIHPSDVEFRPSDVIVCRNTAPLITQAYSFIRRRIPCKVLGREIGQNLVSLVKKMKAKDIESLQTKLDAYEQREMARFFSKGQEQKAEAVKDRCDCVRTVVEGLSEENQTVSAVIEEIEGLFSDDTGKGMLTLCTCHKSKGLEWDRVFVLQPDLMPSKYARQAWQQEQEKHLEYVAITRAKLDICWLDGAKQKGGAT